MKKGFVCFAFILLFIAGWTVGDDLKDWVIAKYNDGAYAVGMGAFDGQPLLLFASPDNDHQVHIGLNVTAEKSEVYLIHKVKSQRERREVILSSIPIVVGNEYPLGTSQNPVSFSWETPITEQGIKVGDWIVVQGYVHELIQAHLVIKNGRRWIEYPERDSVFSVYGVPYSENPSESLISGIEIGLFDGHLDRAVMEVNQYVANEMWVSAKLQIIAKVMKITDDSEKPGALYIFVDFEEPSAGLLLLETRGLSNGTVGSR